QSFRAWCLQATSRRSPGTTSRRASASRTRSTPRARRNFAPATAVMPVSSRRAPWATPIRRRQQVSRCMAGRTSTATISPRRMKWKWMGRLSLSFNNPREHFDDPNGVYDTNGNPTPTITEPLVHGGAYAPQSTGNGQGAIYMNARWQFNANGAYIAPYGIEL